MNLLKLSPKTFRFILLILVTTNIGHAAQGPASISKMQENLGKSSHEIFELGAKIRSLEKQLGSKNEQYLAHLESLKKLDKFIGKIRDKISENSHQLVEEKKRVAGIYEQALLNDLDQESDVHLYKKELLLKIFEDESNQLEKIENRNKKLLTILDNYENQLFEMKQNEKAIYELIVAMENEKKNLSQNYLSKVEVKNELEKKLDIEIARNKTYVTRSRSKIKTQNLGINFQLPFEGHKNYKSSKKGISLKYEGVKPIYATADGKVAYIGRLAAYGNVIILDHGNEIRSVILGDFATKVVNGENLKKGDLVGYTKNEIGASKSLYYEIRKKNIAQNTYNILKANKVL